MRQTSRRYSNLSHSLSKKVTCTRAVVLKSCHKALEGPLAWVICTHYLSRIPKMKSPWVSDWVIWVVMECSRHNLSIFTRVFGSGTAVKQGTGWYLSHDSVEGATYEIVFPSAQISTAAGVKAQWSTTSEKLLYQYAELPQRVQFVFEQNCF
jgi:hypothetical protein